MAAWMPSPMPGASRTTRGVGLGGDLHLRLPDADRLHQDHVAARRVQHPDRLRGGPGQAAQVAAGGHGADVDARVGGVLRHPHPVAEQRAAGERRGRVDGQHADPLALPAGTRSPAPRWRSTCRRPGEPVRPTTYALPVSGASAAITSRSCGDAPSTREISRATARGLPSLACATSEGTSCHHTLRSLRSTRSQLADVRTAAAQAPCGHPHDQRVALPAAAAQRRRADAAAAPLQLQREVQHDAGRRTCRSGGRGRWRRR